MLAKAFQQNLSRRLPALARRAAVVSATRTFSTHPVVKQATAVTTPSNGNYSHLPHPITHTPIRI